MNSSRNLINTSQRRSPKEDEDVPDIFFPVLTMPKHNKKHTMAYSETPDKLKSDLELPPII